VHLRAIILNGFKTFARRTEIRFDGGMVAIVGPNGSGKSNIVDAFKWALGETQAKDLRGARMDEVIYAGGERGGRAAMAEVGLLFDNSQGRLAIDYAEVEIKRRVERGGSSEYFLNGTHVRRRDIQKLLSSTGLTVDAYSIVSQSDIEAIITATPEQRRQLLEEAAQVRGVKQQRSEAASRMAELAQNLLRLEDVRRELEPRREQLRAQATAAREAAEAERRLELLRGSIVFEEWREARDSHRRATSQRTGLERRLEEANATAAEAEAAFQAGRVELTAAQDRRVARQRDLAALRLALTDAEHRLALNRERAGGLARVTESAAAELRELAARTAAAGGLKAQLERDLAHAEQALAEVAGDPARPEPADAPAARDAAAAADSSRRRLAEANSALAGARTRRQFLEESAARLESRVVPAEATLPAATARAADAAAVAGRAADAATAVIRIRAELDGFSALWPEPAPDRRRVGDVLTAAPGWEAALSAALGGLVDAWVAPDPASAEAAAAGAGPQRTILLPAGRVEAGRGSLAEHVRAEPGFEWLAAQLLGEIGAGAGGGLSRWATREGVYREPGLIRAGDDDRVRLAIRRRELTERLAALLPIAETSQRTAALARKAEAELAEVRDRAAGRPGLMEALNHLESARAAETELEARLPELERAESAAAERASELRTALHEGERRIAAWEAERRRLESERSRWRERAADLRRQLMRLEAERELAEAGTASRSARLAETETALREAREAEPELEAAVAAARQALNSAEDDSPSGEAELAEAARRLVSLEEARVDARLRVRTLEGNLELVAREVELLEARMEEIRNRLPLGQAPEEVPGGKAREKEMRQLERRLEELGPVNPLAESEHVELEERCRTIDEQLADITAARSDLEGLVRKLREEEDSRYDAVFGAVAAGFQEYFAELSAGGKASLRHVEGDDGPQAGVEILVQPPRKRLQNITLLSSGERSLTALALVLALAEVNPAPFMILDEVDAALDDANVGRYGEVLHRLGEERQLIVITHNHVTMASAAALYGIHLDEAGRSHIVSVRLEDIRTSDRKARTA
jgi:chromosome segregation protein